MLREGVFSWTDKRIIRQVFLAGAIYFLLTTIYSLIHYPEKLLWDASSLTFTIINLHWFPTSEQREVMYLAQVLPVLGAMAGLKIKWIIISFVINTYIFYFILFALVVLVFKDAVSGILFLLVHYKGDPYNYFSLVEEMLPGACLVVVLLSIFRNFSTFKSRLPAYAAVLVVLLFVVRSHPFALVCLACSTPILFFTNREFFKEHSKTIIIAAVAGVLLLAAKILFLNPYDAQMIWGGKGVIGSAVQLMHWEYFCEITFYLFTMRMEFTIAFVATVVYLMVNKQYNALLVFLLVTAGSVVIFNVGVTQSNFKSYELSHTSYDRWSLHIRFIAFAGFAYFVLASIKEMAVYRALRAAGIFIFVLGTMQITEARETRIDYLKQVDHIIKRCREQGVAKAMVRISELDGRGLVMTNCYQDIMLFSSFNSPDSTIQVVYVTDSLQSALQQLKANQIILDEYTPPIPLKKLNPIYYRLKEAPYRLVNLYDTARLK